MSSFEFEALSLIFHTPSAAWARAAAELTGSRRSRPRSVDVIVTSRRGRRHADVEASRHTDHKCVEWDIYVHEGAVGPSWRATSKRVGWLEGFGEWIGGLYPQDLVIGPVRCSATFEFERSKYTNALGLPKEMALGPAEAPRSVFSIGVEEGEGRWWLEADPDNDRFTVGVGFLLESVAPAQLLARAEQEAAIRVEKLVTSVPKP